MTIIKIGSSEQIDWDNLSIDIKNYIEKEPTVIVHGASITRNKIANKLGYPPQIITSPSGIQSVYTNKKAIEILLMAYPGLVNKQIVANLLKVGINTVGLSGIDGKTWISKKKDRLLSKKNNKIKVLRNNLSGQVIDVDITLISLLLKNNFLPVLTTPSITLDGEIINSDNDTAIAIMAQKLNATRLITLFEAPGLLSDFPNKDSLIKNISINNSNQLMQHAKGRMKKKIIGIQMAIDNGIKEIYMGDVRLKSPITNVLQGNGTIIK